MSGLVTIAAITTLFVLPVVLYMTLGLKKRYRLPLFYLIVILVIITGVNQSMSLSDFGILLQRPFAYLAEYVTFTLVGLLVIYLIIWIQGIKPITSIFQDRHFRYHFLGLSIGQEVMYRGYLMFQLSLLSNKPFFIITFSSALFAYLHSIYEPKWLSIILAFVIGVAFSIMYLTFPNLILISLSHAILNFMAVAHGLFNDDQYVKQS